MLSSYGWIIKMKLHNNPILLKLDLIELAELHSYERKTGEFGKETKSASSRDSQGKLRSRRSSTWFRRILLKK